MKARWISLCSIPLALVVTGAADAQTPVGTAFTYQGRLTAAGAPANGSYDMQFTLYDAGTSGSVVAGPIAAPSVAVTDGLFVVSLDFGAQLTGDAGFLEVGVKPAGSGGDTPCSRRARS